MPSEIRVVFLMFWEAKYAYDPQSPELPDYRKLVRRALERIAASHGFPDVNSFIQTFLPYVLSEWRKTQASIEHSDHTYKEFPIRLISRDYECKMPVPAEKGRASVDGCPPLEKGEYNCRDCFARFALAKKSLILPDLFSFLVYVALSYVRCSLLCALLFRWSYPLLIIL